VNGTMNESLPIDLGRAIKSHRLAKGIRQTDLAEQLGVEPTTISRYERGDYSPSLDVLQAIADALHVPLQAFFAESDEPALRVAQLRHAIVDAVYSTEDVTILSAVLRLAHKQIAAE
jgi:transcriptional regulator with XRE-family HTH domain